MMLMMLLRSMSQSTSSAASTVCGVEEKMNQPLGAAPQHALLADFCAARAALTPFAIQGGRAGGIVQAQKFRRVARGNKLFHLRWLSTFQ